MEKLHAYIDVTVTQRLRDTWILEFVVLTKNVCPDHFEIAGASASIYVSGKKVAETTHVNAPSELPGWVSGPLLNTYLECPIDNPIWGLATVEVLVYTEMNVSGWKVSREVFFENTEIQSFGSNST